MQHQITYLSPGGHAEMFAEAFCEILPRSTAMERLDRNPSIDADIHLVGFELNTISLNAIPGEVINFLDELDNKIIFLFATVPFAVNDSVSRQIHNRMISYLPRDCDYRGMYLSPAAPSDALLCELKRLCRNEPQNERAKAWLERCEKAQRRPNNRDVQKAVQFMKHVLEI